MKKVLAFLLAILILSGVTVCGSAESGKYDLDDYGYRPVVTRGRGSLVFQESPRGSFLSGYRYDDGDEIFVNLTWRQDGYAIAWEDGVYGYVDASYIDWGTSGGTGGSGGAKDLDVYEYRTVDTRGRGSLVFQSSPRGSFLSGYRYDDGDLIFVNPYWRQDGYAMAWEDGVFGYVDASYIDWEDGGREYEPYDDDPDLQDDIWVQLAETGWLDFCDLQELVCADFSGDGREDAYIRLGYMDDDASAILYMDGRVRSLVTVTDYTYGIFSGIMFTAGSPERAYLELQWKQGTIQAYYTADSSGPMELSYRP